MLSTQHGHLDYQTRRTWLGMISWAQVLHRAHRRRSDIVQPYRSVFPGMSVLPNWTKLWWLYKRKFRKVNPGLLEAVTRLSNVGDQLICWLCVAKKPVFMLIHEFMQQWTQLFSYLDNGYLHWTMELPTAQEKSKQIFFALLKGHQYKFRDKQDSSATFITPKVKNMITMMTWINLIVRIHMSHLVSLFQMRN